MTAAAEGFGVEGNQPEITPAGDGLILGEWTEDLTNFPNVPDFTGPAGLNIPMELKLH
ncbi:hypothetical protein PoB_007226500 [Plakobranchus ocellatus]|uniref:Uncharacterized protein n=1 Tax=Plakobranchus ocellatus TaxID=259542 RepID=A0AAV4DNP6_9GAST|nr:hypothetical protein PoB_007226500 [Plakobranchus ocellatus]